VGRYIIKRLLIGLVTLYVLVTIVFFLMKIMPGGPFDPDVNTDPRLIVKIQEYYNFDKPILVQYLLYLKNLVTGSLGESYRKPGATVINSVVTLSPVTFSLGAVAFIISVSFGIGLGIISALTKKRAVRNAIMAFITTGVSIPGFLLGLFLIYIFAKHLRILPVIGLKSWKHYIMPSLALSFYPIAFISRMTRSVLTEVMRQDYIIMAKAKGLSKKAVVFKQALKNALLPVVTYMGPMIAYLMTGSFVVENLFAIPGIGREFVAAIQSRDYPMILGLSIFLGAFVIAMNLVVDIVNCFIDPRIKFQS